MLFRSLATVDEWHFAGPDTAPILVKVSGRIRVSASEGMRSALLEGLGLAVCPTWLFTDEIDTGVIERVLNDFAPAPLPIQAVYPRRRLVSPRVRAFVDCLVEEFRADPRLAA